MEGWLETLTEGRVRARDATTLPLGDLIDLRRDVEKRLRNLKVELRKVRANPAWKFRSLLKVSWRVTLLRNQITKELQADLFQMRRSKKYLEDKIAAWRRRPRSTNPPQTRRPMSEL